MRRHVKSIAAAFMAIMMLMAISTTAMAAEQVSEQPIEVVTSEATTPDISPQAATRLVGSWHKKVSVKQGACIGTVYLDGGAVLFESLSTKSWGGEGVINVKFYCPETGAFRVGTLAANGVWQRSAEWVNAMPAGTYQILVEYVNPAATYDIRLNFYAK